MKVDKRQYSKSETRVQSIDMRGPLFLAGYSEKYSPPFLSVRTQSFYLGHLRNIKINEKNIDYLAPRQTMIAPEFFHLTATLNLANHDRAFETNVISVND